MLLIFHFGLIDLFAVLLVFLVCFFLEVTPLIEYFVELLLKTVTFNFLLVLSIQRIREFDFEFSDFIIS